MKKLTKEQLADKAKHSSAIFDAHAELESAIDIYNENLEAAKESVEALQTTFNEKIGEARDFCEQIVSDMDNYAGDRSDKWQESDAGSSFNDWKSEWESISLDECELEFPEPLDVPENPQEVLDGLPEEVS